MKQHSYQGIWAVMVVALAVVMIPAVALASPLVNGALMHERVFDDCPASALTTSTAGYPALISVEDIGANCFGFANLHTWHFSEDAGASDAVFNNTDHFTFCASLVIGGDGEAEAGLQVAPWWSQNVDGRFNVRTTDGEIACFGGRLPFYSFTGSDGLTYVKGTTIVLTVTYRPNGLSAASPATIEYEIDYNAVHYTSGQLAFDEGNPAEGKGSWGMLDDARVGGYIQVLWQAGGPNSTATADWSDICYDDLGSVAVESKTWGGIKKLY
jgi:hypothetical protein